MRERGNVLAGRSLLDSLRLVLDSLLQVTILFLLIGFLIYDILSGHELDLNCRKAISIISV